MELSRHAPVYLILPGKPTLREQFAADELFRYLFLVLGVKAEKADSAIPGANSFLIGVPHKGGISWSSYGRGRNLFGNTGQYRPYRRKRGL